MSTRVPTPVPDGAIIDLDALPIDEVLDGTVEAVPAGDEDEGADSLPPLPESRYDYAALARINPKMAEDARRAATEIRVIYGRVRGDIAAIGAHLIRMKKRLPHGQYQPWLMQEFGWPGSTARHYVRVAKGATRLEAATVAVLPVTAIALLANATDAVVEEVNALVDGGQTVTLDVVRGIIAERQEYEAAARMEALPPPGDDGDEAPPAPEPLHPETRRALTILSALRALDGITQEPRQRDLEMVVSRIRDALTLYGEQATRAAGGDRVIKGRMKDSWRAAQDAVEGLERLTGIGKRTGARRVALPLGGDPRWAEVGEALDLYASYTYGLTQGVGSDISALDVERLGPLVARLRAGLDAFAPAE